MIQYCSTLCILEFIEKTINSHKIYIRYNKGMSMYFIVLSQKKEFFTPTSSGKVSMSDSVVWDVAPSVYLVHVQFLFLKSGKATESFIMKWTYSFPWSISCEGDSSDQRAL